MKNKEIKRGDVLQYKLLNKLQLFLCKEYINRIREEYWKDKEKEFFNLINNPPEFYLNQEIK